MSAFLAVFWREMLLLRRRIKKIAAAAAVSPFLYLVTFGYGVGRGVSVDGHAYAEFLLPGLMAMSGMTQAFGMASEINMARFYSGIFEEVQTSPAGRGAYVAGEVCAGLVRVVLGCVIIICLGRLFGIRLHYGVWFWLAALLNGLTFSALAVALAMLIKSHADQGLLGAFVITPMAFLGGTFFPRDSLPDWLGIALSLLPLSHASAAMRAAALGRPPESAPFLILAGCGIASFMLALYTVGKARD